MPGFALRRVARVVQRRHSRFDDPPAFASTAELRHA